MTDRSDIVRTVTGILAAALSAGCLRGLFDRRKYLREAEKLKAEADVLRAKAKADELENVRRASMILTEQIVAPLKAELDEVRGEVAFLRGAIDRIDGCTRIASCPVLAELRKRNANCN